MIWGSTTRGIIVLYVTLVLLCARCESNRPCGVGWVLQLHVIDSAGVEQFTGINESYIQVCAASKVGAEVP